MWTQHANRLTFVPQQIGVILLAALLFLIVAEILVPHGSVARPDRMVRAARLLSGDELLREVRADQHLANTPVLATSARADEDIRLDILRAGANDFLAKPFPMAELRARADNLVNARLAETRLRALRVINERDRIAMQLHRTVIDNLFAVSLRLGGVRSQARTPAAAARVDEVIGELDAIMRQIRDTIADLASDEQYRS
ncbi:response regulator [Nocardia sp. NPDC004151]|uniref:response regulator n=1 Tax=Nocardia sp. NPDC004151 TaxID=3364304 RepID=UPI0036889431